MDLTTSQVLPSKEEIAQFPRFQNLHTEQIQVIQNLEQCELVREELFQVAVFGFDSESKPTFHKGEVQTGPHLIQLATEHKTYLFQMNSETWDFLCPIFANTQQLKVGFCLKNDAQLFRKKGIALNGVIDLAKCFGHLGLKQTVGVKTAVAVLLQQNFPKNRKISTSNWANCRLTAAQMDYAAADAYACILIYNRLKALNLLPKR